MPSRSHHSVTVPSLASELPDAARHGRHAADRDDRVLVQRIRAGDTAAFEEMFHAYYGPLCALAVGYVMSRAVAEEYVQDVFLWIWERRAQWSIDGELRNYLYSAVRNRALNYVRHQRSTDRWEVSAGEEPGMLGLGQRPRSAEEELSHSMATSALREAIARLPERRRQAITLRWQHNLPYASIAAIMGISVKAVETTLRKAIDSLRVELDSHS